VAGGLAFVTVLDQEGRPQPLLERDKIEDMLLEHSRLHFATADGSTFTRKPLKHLLQYDGLTSFGDYIYEGRPLEDANGFDEPTKAILQNLRRKTPEDEEPPKLDYATLLDGLKKWPEKTTTSPSR